MWLVLILPSFAVFSYNDLLTSNRDECVRTRVYLSCLKRLNAVMYLWQCLLSGSSEFTLIRGSSLDACSFPNFSSIPIKIPQKV